MQQTKTYIQGIFIRYSFQVIQCQIHLNQMENNLSTFNSQEQLKVIAQVLCKMAKFFNEMTEHCLLQLTDSQSLKHKHRMLLNRQALRNFENNKKLEKLKGKEEDRGKKKQNIIQKIKNNKPKHPVSSFFFFYIEKSREIAKERGEVLGSKLAKIVGQLWKDMSEAERQPFEVKARQTRLRYEQQMIQYRMKYADEISKLKQYKKQIKLKRKISQSKKTCLKKDETKKQESVPEQKNQDSSSISSSDQLLELDGLSDSMQNDSLPSEVQNSISSQSFSLHQMQKNASKSLQFDEIEMLRKIEYENTIKVKPNKNENIQNIQHIIQNEVNFLLEGTKFNKPKGKQQENHQIAQEPLQSQAKNEQNQIDDSTLLKIDDIDQFPQQQIEKVDLYTIKRPKGPVSSFFLYYKAEGKKIADEHNLPLGPKAISLASEKWRAMSKQEKMVYQNLSKQTRQKYYNQMQEVKDTYGKEAFDKMKIRNKKETKSKKPRGKRGRS